MRHGGHQRRLAIAPADAADAGPFGGAAAAPVATCQQMPCQGAAGRQRHGGTGCRHLLRDDAFARQQGDAGRVRHGRVQGAVQEPVFQQEAHRSFFDLGGVKGQKERGGTRPGKAIAGLDLQDRLGPVRDAGPDTQNGQKPFGGNGKRIGAPVKSARARSGAGRASITVTRRPPCASARARAGPFSPPPTIRMSLFSVIR